MSFTVQLSVALQRADLTKINGEVVDDVDDFPDEIQAAAGGWCYYFTEQPIQVSEEGLALVKDSRGRSHELEFFMQRPMTEADLL